MPFAGSSVVPLFTQHCDVVPTNQDMRSSVEVRGRGWCAGVPNTGKSEFVDALVLSLAQNYFWPICFASFEKLTHQHFSNLAEKVWGKPFTRREGNTSPLMTEKEVWSTI